MRHTRGRRPGVGAAALAAVAVAASLALVFHGPGTSSAAERAAPMLAADTSQPASPLPCTSPDACNFG